MWSAQGQCIHKGNFALPATFSPVFFFPPSSFSFSHMNTHTAPRSLSGFFLLRLFTLPLFLFLFRSLQRLSETFSLPSSLPFFSSPSSLSLFTLRRCLSTHHTGSQRKRRCNNWIIEQSANKRKTQGTGSMWNACIIWGGQKQSEHSQ